MKKSTMKWLIAAVCMLLVVAAVVPSFAGTLGSTTVVGGRDGKDGKDGVDGKDGKDGLTPIFRVNSQTNEWEYSYTGGLSWLSLGVKAGDKYDAFNKLNPEYIDQAWYANFGTTYGGSIIFNNELKFTYAFFMLGTQQMSFGVNVGVEYDVYWNGKMYTCTAFEDGSELFLGNADLFDGVTSPLSNPEAPFLFSGANDILNMVKKNTSDAETVDVRITTHVTTTYNKLPIEYLPDDLLTEDDVAEMIKNADASIDVTAAPGQTIIVKEVDANGKPTKWRAVDMGYHYFDIVDLLPERTLPEAGMQGGDITFGNIPLLGLVEGETYTYTFDGVTYTSVATKFENLSWGGVTISGVMIGNFGMLDAFFGTTYGDNGQPVIFLDAPGFGGCAFLPTVYGAHTASINGKKEFLKTLDPYIVPGPYYIEVTGAGTEDDPYVCRDTVENVNAMYKSGRQLIVRWVAPLGGSRTADYYIPLYMSAPDMGYIFTAQGFDATGYILMMLIPQEDGSFIVEDVSG